MAIKNDLTSQAANFVSVSEVVETLSELEKVSRQDVLTWLENANSETPMPQTYNLDRATGRMFKDCDSDEIIFNERIRKDHCYDEEEGEQGWLLSEITPYLNARLNFSRQENASNDEKNHPTQTGVLKSILLSQPENTIQSSVVNPGRREQQYEIILAVITALEFDPLQIPDNGKAKIKSVCLTRSRIFTDSGFGHAWKAGVAAGLFKLASHEKYFSK